MADDASTQMLRKLMNGMMKSMVQTQYGANELPKTPLFKAASKGRSDEVREILKTPEGKSHINKWCQIGWAPVHMAAMRGHTETVRILMEEPTFNLDHVISTGETALCLAAQYGHIEIVKMLLAKGANTKTVDRSGRDALACAKRCHDGAKGNEIVKLIMEARKAENAPERRVGEMQYKMRGNDAFKRNDFKTAVAEYSKALEINQLSPILWANRAAAYLELKNYEAAYKDARMSLSLDKTYLKAHYRLAQALYGLTSYFGAKNACNDALELAPTDPTILALLDDINKKLAQFARTSGDADLPASQSFTIKSDEIFGAYEDKKSGIKVWMNLMSSDKDDSAGERQPLMCKVMVRNMGKNIVKLDEAVLAEWELRTLRGSIFRPNFEDGEIRRKREDEKKNSNSFKSFSGVSLSEMNFHRSKMSELNGMHLKKEESSAVTLVKGDWLLTFCYFHVPGCDWAVEAIKKTDFVRVKLLVNGEPVTCDMKVDQAKVKKFYAGFRPGLLGTYDKVAPQKWYYSSVWTAEENVDHNYKRDEENKSKLCLGHVEEAKYLNSPIRNWFQFDNFPTSLVDLKRALTEQAQKMAKANLGMYGWNFVWRQRKGRSLNVRDLFFVDEHPETGERALRPILNDNHVKTLTDGARIHIRWEDDEA
eukprot:TRINITY_DN7492_c0_g1_i1.p1 TRINITY_DN7492_c0_g1~~TRINITY_DN7492_c0_g1_i1.p1  ORF type:complete len:651 (+),score=149.58 TRINITY_DN7492_c0_g1_i1:83-2035(+)